MTTDALTLHQLACFDAVVTEGGFQRAAARLHRTHPSVFAAVKDLEAQLGLKLLDRDGYRVTLTAAGRSFHERTRVFLGELHVLRNHAAHLAMGDEHELRVVIGDLCPLAEVLGLLRRFFATCPDTRLHLHFEAISGPWERLFDDEADLIIHHVDKSDSRIEFVDLCTVQVVPVVAPGFLAFPISKSLRPEQMRDYVQCVIRDTALHSPARSYHLIEGARTWTVSDQVMKKGVIVQGMGWGHMPTFFIDRELRDGSLIPITGRHFPGAHGDLVAARRYDRPHGPVARRLWQHIEREASMVRAAVTPIAATVPHGPKGRTARGRRPPATHR